jgi:hypothetical protein
MKKKIEIDREKRSRSSRRTAPAGQQVVRDAAWEAEKRWFEENRSLDPLALFAKYYQRLG